MTKKKIVHVNIDEVDGIKIPENIMTKLVIHGEQSKITSFRLSNKYNELLKLYKMITFDVNFCDHSDTVFENHNKEKLDEKVLSKIMNLNDKDKLLKLFNLFVKKLNL